jgi:hypothetical protein
VACLSALQGLHHHARRNSRTGIEAGISGLDSPLGIAGALVLEGGVHRWRQLRMTETSRYPLRHQTRPERARCDGFDRFYEIHLFKTA